MDLKEMILAILKAEYRDETTRSETVTKINDLLIEPKSDEAVGMLTDYVFNSLDYIAAFEADPAHAWDTLRDDPRPIHGIDVDQIRNSSLSVIDFDLKNFISGTREFYHV